MTIPSIPSGEAEASDSRPDLAELMESERRYRLLVENLNDGIVISQKDRFIYFNRRFAEMLGYGSEELRALTYAEVYTPHGLAILNARGAARARGEAVPALYETEFRSKSGALIPVEVNVTIITYEGDPATFAIARDISHQKRVEQEQKSFAQMALALSRAQTLDDVGVIVREVTATLFGWDALYFTCRLSGRTRFYSLLRIDTVDGALSELPPTETHLPHGGFMASLKAGEPRLINRRDPAQEKGLVPFGEKSRLSASLIYSPLHRGEAMLAVLSVQSYIPNRYTEADAQLLQRVSNAVRPTVERVLAEKHSRAFLELGRKLSACSTPKEAARIIVGVADLLVGWDACFVDLYTDGSGHVEPLLNMDVIDGVRQEVISLYEMLPPGELQRRVLLEGAFLIEGEYTGEKGVQLQPFGDLGRRSEAKIFSPIRGIQGVIGFLSIQSYTPHAYDDDDLAIVEALANHCSGALERTRAQNQLLKSESRYRTVVETVETVILGVDRNHRIVEWNRQAERLYGYTRAEVIGRNYFDLFVPEGEREFVVERFDRAVIAEPLGGFENSIICRDGTRRVLFWNSTKIHDEDEGVTGLLCCGQDMTERKHWEQELQKSEAYYRAIIEDQTELICRFLPDGTITFANEAFCQYHGAERWQLVGTSIFSPSCLAIRQELRRHLADLDPARSISSTQQRTLSTNGEVRWQEWTDRAILDLRGELLGYQSVGRDITLLRVAQDALHRSQERYLKLLESSSDVIFQITAEGMVAFANNACKAVFGEEPQAFLEDSRLFLALVHPDSRDRFLATLHRFRERGQFPAEVEPFKWLRRDGKIVYTENRIGLLHGTGIDDESLLAVCRDVTDRVRLEQERLELEAQIQQTQKMESMSVLAGGIAHDFNNLLTGILGNASMILGEVPAGLPAHEHSIQIQTAASRAADLTRQMLAYAGKGSFVVKPALLSDIVREMSGLLKTVISPRAEFILDLGGDLPYIQADATQIGQIVMNLITNASDALEGREGRLRLSTGLRTMDAHGLAPLLFGNKLKPGEYVFLEMEDSGCGMDAATQARMFDPFFTRKPTGLVGGRGLGLAAVLGIVRNHGGAIQVRSDVGRGTTFTIILPKCNFQPEASEPQVPHRVEPVPVHRSGTVLVVDDDDVVQRVARTALKKVGYTVLVAGDGIEALAIMNSKINIEAAVVDLRMPRMDGHALCAELTVRYPLLPIVVMSGYTETELHLSDQLMEGIIFLEKPFSNSDLVQALDGAISLRQGELPGHEG